MIWLGELFSRTEEQHQVFRPGIWQINLFHLIIGGYIIDAAWTLVLPPFRQFGESTFERWSDMFDVEKMKGLLPKMKMMESADYLTWRKRVDLVFFLGECPPGIEEKSNFDHNLFGKFCTIGKTKCSVDYRPDAGDANFAVQVESYMISRLILASNNQLSPAS